MGDISKNFSMYEFIQSDTAKAKKIDNIATELNKNNIIVLVENILQPVRDYMGISCGINSGYRFPALTQAVGGSTSSAHMLGTAADITFGSKALNKKAFEWIKANCKYRQLIDEKNFTWIHVEYREGDNKMQVLAIKYTKN